MQWTVRLEARTSAGEATTTELVMFGRPGVVGTLAEIGLMLAESKTLLAKLQASMLCGQVAAYAAHHRACVDCGALQPLKDRRTRRLQTLFGTVEVEAPRFKACRCCVTTPVAAVTVSPVCALLTARCTPELERGQTELGARTSFRDGARILEALLPVSPANHESLRTRTHTVALQLEAADRQAAPEVTAAPDKPDKAAAADGGRPPSSCSMALTCARCRVTRFAPSRRSAARWSRKDSPPVALPWCAAWPSSRMPCRVRRCETRAGGRAIR